MSDEVDKQEQTDLDQAPEEVAGDEVAEAGDAEISTDEMSPEADDAVAPATDAEDQADDSAAEAIADADALGDDVPDDADLDEDEAGQDQDKTGPAEGDGSLHAAADDTPREPEPDDAGLESPGRDDAELTMEQVIEAVLFTSDIPLPLSRLVKIVGVGSARDVHDHIKALNDRYEQQGATFRIEKVANGYHMLTLPQFSTWLRKLKQTKQDSRLSQAALETLAVVAYKQPVVRANIEAVRGVASGEMLNRLRELGLLKIVGRAEDVGRPMLYGTTKRFLEVFGLPDLKDLPEVEELQADD